MTVTVTTRRANADVTLSYVNNDGTVTLNSGETMQVVFTNVNDDFQVSSNDKMIANIVVVN